MIVIPCPWCGPRDESEFTYGGDASRPMPSLKNGNDQAAWHGFVHQRENPKGPHVEYWYHGGGCERWLRVERDTITHQVRWASDAAAKTEPEQ